MPCIPATRLSGFLVPRGTGRRVERTRHTRTVGLASDSKPIVLQKAPDETPMPPRFPSTPRTPSPDLDAALATMSADALRDVVREVLCDLDEPKYSTVVGSLITRAARGGGEWQPAAVTDAQVAEVIEFVKAAELAGQASAPEVDAYLRRGAAAFLRRDYAAAQRIFGALLPAVGDGNVYLGQHEVVDEVLGADLGECAAQYVVAVYMLAPSAERAHAVHVAIHQVDGVEPFWEPLRAMERVAVEPLTDLTDFLPRWHALIASSATGKRTSNWDTEEDRWLREAVERLEGADGLAMCP